jgi:hypothetical protein
MKVDLEEVKENSTYKSSWKSNKELKQRKDKYEGWNVFKTLTIFQEAKAKGGGGAGGNPYNTNTFPSTS